VGTWESYEVTDSIGDDASSTQDPKGVVLEFAADTVRITYNGEKLPKLKWDSLEDIGVIMEDDETYKDLGFELDGDELKFYYDVGDDYYIYKCTKKELSIILLDFSIILITIYIAKNVIIPNYTFCRLLIILL